MGIKASIIGVGEINLDLFNIMSATFRHLSPIESYAKSNDVQFEIVLEINAYRIKDNEPQLLDKIREWENEDPTSSTYYRHLIIEEIYAGRTIRNLEFTFAYIESVTASTIATGEQSQSITLVLHQKRDKYKEIII